MHMCEIMQRCFYTLNEDERRAPYKTKLYRIKPKLFRYNWYGWDKQQDKFDAMNSRYSVLTIYPEKYSDDALMSTAKSLLNDFENKTLHTITCLVYIIHKRFL